MKAKRQKRRYLTANQIRAEIDKYKAKAIQLTRAAEELEIAANRMKLIPEMAEDAAFKRTMAQKARSSAARIHNHKLPSLKEKLAEFGTELLPGVLDPLDRSVSA